MLEVHRVSVGLNIPVDFRASVECSTPNNLHRRIWKINVTFLVRVVNSSLRYTQATPASNQHLWLRESFVRVFQSHVLQFYLVCSVHSSQRFSVQVLILNPQMYNTATNVIWIPTAMTCNITYPVLIMSCLHGVLENSFIISSNNLFKNIPIEHYNYAKYMGHRVGPMRSSSLSRTCYSQVVRAFNY